ncbi:MAG TPA: hypothetical protein VIS99_06970 [Terrimicrobiaceae bacterium]
MVGWPSCASVHKQARKDIDAQREDHRVEGKGEKAMQQRQTLHGAWLFSRMEHPIKSIAGIGSIAGPLIAAELGDPAALRRPASGPCDLGLRRHGPRVRKSGQWSGKNQNE